MLPFAAAVGLATWSALGVGPALAAGYLATCAAGAGLILWAFCARCPCAGKGCGHVVPGMAARALFRPRTPGRYTATELAATAVGVVLILVAPTAWLWRSLPLLGIFLALVIVTLVVIRAMVCRGCGNRNCPGHPAR